MDSNQSRLARNGTNLGLRAKLNRILVFKKSICPIWCQLAQLEAKPDSPVVVSPRWITEDEVCRALEFSRHTLAYMSHLMLVTYTYEMNQDRP